VGITDPRRTFHSFRHALIDDLRDAGVQDSLIKRVAGNEDGAVTFSIYGSRTPLRAMPDALDKVILYIEEIATTPASFTLSGS
jgi:integrase